jgi:O-antigen/teichoic acid export membrane protein
MLARFVSTVLAAIAGFATIALLVRLLGASRYGTLALGLAVVGLVGVAGQLGLGVATTRRIAAMRANGDHTGIEHTAQALTALMISLGIVGSALVTGLMYFTQRRHGAAAALFLGIGLGLLLLGRNAAEAWRAIGRGMGRMILMEAPLLGLVLLQLLISLVLWAMGVDDIRAVALGFGAAGLLCTVVTGRFIRRILAGARHPFRPAARSALGLIVLAAPYAVAAITTQFMARFDVLILGLSHSRAVVGAYESTLRIVEGFLLLMPGVLIAPFVPAATGLFTKDDPTGFRNLYIFVSKLAYLGSLPVILALLAFPQVVLRAFFGAHYPAAKGVVWILLAGYIVNLTFGLNSQALIATGQRRLLAKIYGIALVSMVVLAVVLIPVFGATGAAVSTSCSYLVLNVSVGVALFRTVGVSPFRADMVALLLTSLLPAALALLVGQVAERPGVPFVLVVSLALSALWFGVVLGTRAIRVRELVQLFPARRATSNETLAP